MSRYTAQIPEDNLLLAWGFDRPMSEYFFQAFRLELDEEVEDDDACLFSISSYFTLTPHPDYPDRTDWANSEIAELMKTYVDKVPQLQHAIDSIQLDIPF